MMVLQCCQFPDNRASHCHQIARRVIGAMVLDGVVQDLKWIHNSIAVLEVAGVWLEHGRSSGAVRWSGGKLTAKIAHAAL